MKWNQLLLRMLLTILLTFAVTLSAGTALLHHLMRSPDFWLKQVEQTNTCGKVHQALLEDLSGGEAAIPAEVYAQVYTPEWTEQAVQAQIRSSFAELDGEKPEAPAGNTEIEGCLTVYF